MRAVGLIMRLLSFLFHLVLIAFMLAASILAWFSNHNLILAMLPWEGPALTYWLFGSGLAGLLIALLAWNRILPVLFLLWNVAVLAMLVRGYFFSSYKFPADGSGLMFALYLTLAALLAACGSFFHLRQSRHAARRQSVLV